MITPENLLLLIFVSGFIGSCVGSVLGACISCVVVLVANGLNS